LVCYGREHVQMKGSWRGDVTHCWSIPSCHLGAEAFGLIKAALIYLKNIYMDLLPRTWTKALYIQLAGIWEPETLHQVNLPTPEHKPDYFYSIQGSGIPGRWLASGERLFKRQKRMRQLLQRKLQSFSRRNSSQTLASARPAREHSLTVRMEADRLPSGRRSPRGEIKEREI